MSEEAEGQKAIFEYSLNNLAAVVEKAAGAAAAEHLFHGAENGPTPMFPEEDDEGDDTQGESHTGRVMGQNVV